MLYDCFLAQLLVLIMIFFCSVRVFFLKKARVDCFAVFAPLSLIVSVLILFFFDFSYISITILLLSLLVFFTNFRSVLRLHAQLIVDGYSPVFVIFSILNLIAAAVLTLFVVLLRPVKYRPEDFSAKKTYSILTGRLDNLRIRENYFLGEKFSGNLFLYEPSVSDEITNELYSSNPIVIFAPGIRSTSQNYEPYFLLLAQKGYKVLSADLYTPETNLLSKYSDGNFSKSVIESKFFRRFAAIHLEKIDPKSAEELLKNEKELSTKKYEALTNLALKIFGEDKKVFYVVDEVDFDSIYAAMEKFNTESKTTVAGFFSMNRVDEYQTAGYGFIEQTDVLLAREKGLEREDKFFIPRYIANKTQKAIMEAK